MSKDVRTVVVVGATRSIGPLVVAEGMHAGFTMRAGTSLRTSRFVSTDAHVVVGEITDASTLGVAVAGVDAIVVTHGANGRPPGA